MANRILLPNGCSMSTPSVNPRNWKSGGNSLLKKNWQIQYYFYSDLTPKGKLIVVKGMNEFKNIKDRREITQSLIDDEIYNNQKGYNPILKKYFVEANFRDAELHPNLPFITAFKIALQKIDCTDIHRKQIEWAIKRIAKAATKFQYDRYTISQLKRKDLKRILEACKLTDSYFNKFRSYLSRLFSELLEYECCETNLIRDIRKKKVVKKQRNVLSLYHMAVVMDYLKDNYYEFWRYAQIFLYSGSRSSELFSVKKKDVSISDQEFKIVIKKGSYHKEATKVIIKEVIPLWKELLKQAKPNDYLFSKGLIPGPEQILANQITKRWYRLVKKSDRIVGSKGEKITISADFYSLKHSFLDSLPIETAQQIASHTSSKTTEVYQVNREKRLRDLLKDLDVSMSK